MLSRCGSVAMSVSLRMIAPVSASARNISIANRSRSERNTRRVPSGLRDGPTLSRRPCSSSVMSARPRGAASMRSSGRYVSAMEPCQALGELANRGLRQLLDGDQRIASVGGQQEELTDDALAKAARQVRPGGATKPVWKVAWIVEVLEPGEALCAARHHAAMRRSADSQVRPIGTRPALR